MAVSHALGNFVHGYIGALIHTDVCSCAGVPSAGEHHRLYVPGFRHVAICRRFRLVEDVQLCRLQTPNIPRRHASELSMWRCEVGGKSLRAIIALAYYLTQLSQMNRTREYVTAVYGDMLKTTAWFADLVCGRTLHELVYMTLTDIVDRLRDGVCTLEYPAYRPACYGLGEIPDGREDYQHVLPSPLRLEHARPSTST